MSDRPQPLAVFTRRIRPIGIEKLAEAGYAIKIWDKKKAPTRKQLLRFVAGATAIIPIVDDTIDAAVMDAAGPQLRVIACYSVGHNNVDKQEAANRGIRVTNTPDLLTDATADLTWTIMMALVRKIIPAVQYVKNGLWDGWDPMGFLGMQLKGKVLGIIGMGRIGRALAERARGFGITVVFYDPMVESDCIYDAWNHCLATKVTLARLYEIADIVTLHCDLNDSTKGMINEGAFRLMRAKKPYVVNVARGGLIVSAALRKALRKGWIAGAALDVTDPEPIRKNDSLLKMDNVLIVPHIGSGTFEARDGMGVMDADSIIACVTSDELPTNCVNAHLLAA